MAYIPEHQQVEAAQRYLRAEAAYLAAEVHRARTDFRHSRGLTSLDSQTEAHDARHRALTNLDEARIAFYLICGYYPEQVRESLARAIEAEREGITL